MLVPIDCYGWESNQWVVGRRSSMDFAVLVVVIVEYFCILFSLLYAFPNRQCSSRFGMVLPFVFRFAGAPLIAIVAIMGLAVDLTSFAPTLADLDGFEQQPQPAAAIVTYIGEKMKYLETSRPTAVNLQNAMTELQARLESSSNGAEAATRASLVQTVVDYADFMYARDTSDNQHIGQHGAKAILQQAFGTEASTDKVTIMTICNTGSLATSHYGTALGVVRALRDNDRLHQIVALETRPYNQGSRLTAYEMVVEQMPNATLICDNMAAAFMKQHKVHACVVGADRVCANGGKEEESF